MRLPEFEHFRPESLQAALDLLSEHGEQARVNAGGTDLLVLLKQGLRAPRYLIDLKGIPGLDVITQEKRVLRIGALTRLATLIRSPLVQAQFPVLVEAARSVAAPPIQTMGTLGGNLCQDTRCFYYNQSEFWRESRSDCFKRGGTACHAIKGGKRCVSVYQGDLAPVLIALNAQVCLQGPEGHRTVPLGELYTGKGEAPLDLQAGELLTEVEIPCPAHALHGAYRKLRYREALDYPLVGVAAVLGREGQQCVHARVVVTAVASAPIVIEKATQLVEGSKVGEAVVIQAAEAAFEAVHPLANIGSTPLYRRKMVRVLTRQAMVEAWG